MRPLWTRCYYSASLNLLKKWSIRICFFFPPMLLCLVIQLLFSFKPICYIKCFVQNNFNVSSISTKVVTDTRWEWLILQSWQILSFVLLFFFPLPSLAHLRQGYVYIKHTSGSWRFMKDEASRCKSLPCRAALGKCCKKARVYSTVLRILACYLHCWRTTLRL